MFDAKIIQRALHLQEMGKCLDQLNTGFSRNIFLRKLARFLRDPAKVSIPCT